MEVVQQWWTKKMRYYFSFKKATIAVCVFNLISVIFIINSFLFPSSSSRNSAFHTALYLRLLRTATYMLFAPSSCKSSPGIGRGHKCQLSLDPVNLIHVHLPLESAVRLKYIIESEELRRSMEPLELIKRVREIEKEAYVEPEPGQQKDAKQTAAVDLFARLNDLHSYSDGGSFKALMEWRKRKIERARQHELG